MDTETLSPLSEAVVRVFERKEPANHEPKITVNRFLSEIASWYEKLRTAMDISDDEVVLRSAIERIVKRRIILGGDGESMALPVLRELIWARYFPNGTIPESYIQKTATIIQLHLDLKELVSNQHVIKETALNEWTIQLISCHLARLLSPNIEKNTMSNFMYHIMKDRLEILDDTEDTKNVQVYLAVRRAFAKDDIAFLRFYLFQQIFGELTKESLDNIATSFGKGYKEIEYQLSYKLREKIFMFVKKRVPVFYILEDVLRQHKKDIRKLLEDPDVFKKTVFDACDVRYKGVRKKVITAIVRSVVFLLITKAAIAIGIEGSYEKWAYGHVVWTTIGLNIGIPPLLMIITSFFIKTPKEDNSARILDKINTILFEKDAQIIPTLKLVVKPQKNTSVLGFIFWIFGLMAFVVSFGLVLWVLNKAHFNPVSQVIFVFFLTVVSFLAYRINSTAHSYSVDEGQGLLTPFIDFLIIPIVRVGMYFTEGISQINIIIFVFDFLIEAPFKAIFSFFDQFFSYLHNSREDLG